MANRKAIVKYADLPPVTSNNTYRIRYRIISEDRNRSSHWSPIVEVASIQVQEVPGTVSYADGLISIVWGDANNRPLYDVFVRLDYDPITNNSEYVYHGTSKNHNYFLLNEASNSVDIIIQIASTDRVVSELLQVYSATVLI